MRAIGCAIALILCLALPTAPRAGNLSVLLCNTASVDLFDCFDLVVLYNSTDGANWRNNTNWGTPDVGTWFGVTVNPLSARVVALDLAFNGLDGPFPPQWTGLQRLEFLQLSNNALRGELPAYLGNLTALKLLQIGFNILEGPIPDSLGNLSQLDNLFLGGNRFSGPLPASIGTLTRLEVLDVFSDSFDSQGRLTGPLPDLSRLTRLRRLHLEANRMDGPFPDYLDQMPDLESLRLDGNNFTGVVPSNLGTLSKLTLIDLSGNELSGAIPASLGNLPLLEELDLSFNHFSSTLPPALGALSSLRRLRIAGAPVARFADRQSLSGPIPPSFANLIQLEELDLAFNTLSGRLPECLGNLPALSFLSLQVNDLEGPIPDAFAMLNLGTLHISNNLFDSNAGQLSLTPPLQAWFAAIPNTEAVIPGFGTLNSLVQRTPAANPDAIFDDGFEMAGGSACP